MGHASRHSASDLGQDVPQIEDVSSYQFYQLVELLTRLEPMASQSLLFSSNPSLGFAPADVSELRPIDDGRWLMSTHFLGLSGAQSPLPSFMLERLATEDEHGIKRPFFDFFNHRIITLVHEIWRKYRYYLRFESGATDVVSSQFFALVGLGDAHLRAETPINWCKMLSYAGTLAGRSRSPQVVAGIVAHCFDLEDVYIRQWEKRELRINPEQKCTLGMNNVSLGQNSVIGDVATDISGKFTICLSGLTRARFEDFLPSGKEFLPLCTLVEFMLREPLAYDLELSLNHSEPMQVQLTPNHDVKLGWSSFLGEPQENKRILIQVRQ